MVQTRVCSFLKGDCKHVSQLPTTFLSLPEELRHRIYYYHAPDSVNTSLLFTQPKDGIFVITEAGDDQHPVLDLTDVGSYSKLQLVSRTAKQNAILLHHGPVDHCIPGLRHKHPALKCYSNLRLVSLTVKSDIPRCLFSYHRLIISIAELPEASLPTVLDLLIYCKCLTIILRIATPPPCSRTDHRYCDCKKLSAQHPFRRLGFQKFILPAWKKCVHQLALSPHISKLDLTVLYDPHNSEEIELILKPLRRLRIRKCTLRLSSIYDQQLEVTAREAVYDITGQTREPFRLLDLPTELRQHILSFTDLVTPFRDVEWSPSSYSLQDSLRRRHACRRGILCRNHNTVYPGCDCFRSPLPLFLVCRTLLKDARHVFYSSNRFVVVSGFIPAPDQSTSLQVGRFGAAKFLTDYVPREYLGSLRNVEILFSGTKYNHLEGIHPESVQDWDRAIQYAAPHLKRLNLSVYLGYEYCPYRDPVRTEESLSTSQNAIFDIHRHIVRPLQRLRACLDDFSVDSSSPFQGSDEETRAIRPLLREQERRLEVLVMGSGYESVAIGESGRKKGRWLMKMYDIIGDID